MKPHSLFSASLLLALTLAGSADGQVFTPPTSGGGNSGGGGNTNSTTVVNQQGSQNSSKPVLGNEVPFFDMSSENVMIDGKVFNIGDNRVMRARFEKYLNTAEENSEADIAYRKTIRSLLDALSPHKKPNLPKAVALLQNASQFDQDARLCESLANAIYRVWLAKKSVGELQRLNQELDRQRSQLDWSYDQWSGSEKLSQSQPQPAGKGKGKGTSTTQTTKEAGHISRYVQRIAEVEATRVANKAKMELSDVQAKIEFQALIVQFFAQRRFEHVIMAARLYTEFFQDGNGALDFKEGSDVEQMFGKSIGFNPTITTLDAFSNEAIRDVDTAVEAFHYLLEKGEVDGATRQLQQAFMVGEFLPTVQTVPREDKRKVLEYAQSGFAMVSAIEVRDYTLAEEKINRMRELASDFDYAKPRAVIETSKITANMHIRNAKNAMLKGDDQGAADNIRKATEIWPTNPELTKQFNMMSDVGDVQLQAKIEFDQMLSTQRYRQIYNDRGRLAVAVYDDEDRRKAFEEIIGNIQEIETVLKQAEALKNGGNAHAAWELVEKTFEKFNDDVPLSAKRSDLSTDVADFVRAVKTAQRLEDEQPGSSLAWFLKSRELYPQSNYAAEGIERIVDKILPSDGNFGTSTTSAVAAPDDGFFGN